MWHIAPSEFWRMHPQEFLWLLDLSKPRKEYAGGMTEMDVARIYEETYGNG